MVTWRGTYLQELYKVDPFSSVESLIEVYMLNVPCRTFTAHGEITTPSLGESAESGVTKHFLHFVATTVFL